MCFGARPILRNEPYLTPQTDITMFCKGIRVLAQRREAAKALLEIVLVMHVLRRAPDLK